MISLLVYHQMAILMLEVDMEKESQVQDALDYIEDNLKKEIFLEDIALVAGMSLYYFHRVFRRVTDYSLKEYIRLRRLTCAAVDLISSNDPIKHLAGDYLFDSTESFSRAFNKQFNIPPGKFRRLMQPFPYTAPFILNNKLPQKGATMKAEIITKKELLLVGKSIRLTQGTNNLTNDYMNFYSQAIGIKNIIQEYVFGICSFNMKEDLESQNNYAYMAAFEVSKIEDIPEGMEVKNITDTKYAVFYHKGSQETIGVTFSQIFTSLLKENGLKAADKEEYLIILKHKLLPGDQEIQIFVPVQ